MAGETTVQSPAIGNALRQALSLDAAGSMGMDAGLTVHPVCIVGDVRSQLGKTTRGFSGFYRAAATAGQFGRVALSVPSTATAGNLLYAQLTRLRFYTNAFATLYWRIGQSTTPVSTDAPARGLDSLAISPGIARVIGGPSAEALTVMSMQGLIVPAAGVQGEWTTVPEVRLWPVAAGDTLFEVWSDTALVQVVCELTWDEYYKP